MPHWINKPWQRNLSKIASGKPWVVHLWHMTTSQPQDAALTSEPRARSAAHTRRAGSNHRPRRCLAHRPRHSARMPASLTILPHSACSARTWRANSSIVPPPICSPRSAIRLRASSSRQAMFSLSLMYCARSAGRPRGPNRPTQAPVMKFGRPDSSAVGTLGKAGSRVGEVTMIGRSLPS